MLSPYDCIVSRLLPNLVTSGKPQQHLTLEDLQNSLWHKFSGTFRDYVSNKFDR